MDSAKTLHLDVEKIIKDRVPNAEKRIPRFVYKMVASLICQDQMNLLLDNTGHLEGVDFAAGILKELNVKVVMDGEENIPQEGKFIFASNHPLGGLDGMALMELFGKKYNKKIRFVVNDILMNLKNLKSIFIPINKHGSQARDTAEVINDAFESDNQILIFPAGLCSRLQNGEIKDLEWKKTVIAKSVEYKRDIIPVYFEGQNSKFFYNFAHYRKKIGIKPNLEMVLLPSEMFKNKNKTFIVRVGKPIPWQTFDKTRSQKGWADFLKHKVYELKQR